MARSSGIGTYIRETVPRVLTTLQRADFALLGDTADLGQLGLGALPRTTLHPCDARIYSLREQWALRRASPARAHVFWSPHYNIPLLLGARLVVTVHDVLHLARPEFVTGSHRRLYARSMFAMVARRAAEVICVSRFTADELIRLVGIDARRIHVTHEGVDPRWFLPAPGPPTYPRPYFVYVGNVKPHKNLSRLCRAFAQVVDVLPHDLVIVGKKDGFLGGDPQVDRYASRLGNRVHFTGEVPDERLRNLVGNATALVLPSKYEGFGLPALEAMAAGCPAIVSRAASLPEVCGDAAAYFDPDDPDEIAHRLQEIARDGVLREDLIAAGRERARKYTWESCAQSTREVLQRVLDAG